MNKAEKWKPSHLRTPEVRRFGKPKKPEPLSPNMISVPLGDLRHKSHIGVNGEDDMFGDISFIKGRTDLLPTRSLLDLSKIPGPTKPPRLYMHGFSPQAALKDFRPAFGSLNDLHQMDTGSPLPQTFGDDLATISTTTETEKYEIKDKIQTTSAASHTTTEFPPDETEHLYSFQVDLGPSMLDDVLKIMDSHKNLKLNV